ncbi:MAG: Ig-like domain-containing protein [Bacteroidales bacterium]|nr:Ig-like domain-containing protein [Bacteroidales bacterium]
MTITRKLFLGALSVLIGLTACSKTDAPIDEGGMKVNDLTLFVGEKGDLVVSGAPEGAKISYKSANTTIASVTSKGVVTGRKAGNTDITVTVNTEKLTSHVTVKEVPPGVVVITGVNLGSNFSLQEGATRQLSPAIVPDNATDKEAALKTIKYSSSKTSVATVSSTGLVTAKTVPEGSSDTAVITATVTSEGKEYSGTVTVTVTSSKIPTTGIALDKANVKLNPGESTTVNVSFVPANHTDSPTVVWSSSKTSVATVSNGRITAVDYGSATITATIQGTQIKAECAVTVADGPQQATVIDMSNTYFVYTWPDAEASQEALTLECWVFMPAGSSDNNGAQSFVGTEGVFLIREQQGKFQAVTGGGSASGWTQSTETVISANATTGEWKHVAATYSADKSFILYIDGVKAAEGTSKLDGTLPLNGITGYTDGNNPNVFMIGNAYGRNRFFKGNLAFVRVWGRALSETEIAANMYVANPTGSGLLANWKFTEGGGNTISDASGKSRTLTPVSGNLTWVDGTLPAVK